MNRPVIRTLDQHRRVFVSSTLQEVVDEHKAARQAIEHLRLAPDMGTLRELSQNSLALCRVFPILDA